jgi:hypothetical protein
VATAESTSTVTPVTSPPLPTIAPDVARIHLPYVLGSGGPDQQASRITRSDLEQHDDHT